MPKIIINKTFKDLKGQVLKIGDEELTLGKVLSDIVLTPHKEKNGFRPLKSLELAKRFYGVDAKNKEVEIDKSDFIQIKELVENNDGYFPIVLAQVIEELNKSESKEK